MALPGKVKAAIKIAAAILILLALWLGYTIYAGATKLSVTCYDIPMLVTQPIRIVQLSDLHSDVYGEENAELLAMVEENMPDLIFLTGDMLNSKGSAEDVTPLCSLITALSELAPVYWSDGNHELSFMQATGIDLHSRLMQAGAIVLDNGYVDIAVNDQQIRVGGYYGYYGAPHLTTSEPSEKAEQEAFFEDFEDTTLMKLLLCHIPTPWVDWDYVDKYPVNVIFSGHYHGGQVRLPLLGGLYAPYVGFFPEHTRGIFEGSKGVCILSAGVGSEPGFPRINNLPEIVVVNLIPASK